MELKLLCRSSVFSFQIRKQIELVNGVYRLHNLPEFYQVGLTSRCKSVDLRWTCFWFIKFTFFFYLWPLQNPRPHISVAWAVGDISDSLRSVIGKEMKRHIGVLPHRRIFACEFGGMSCKIGNRTYEICKIPELQ